MRSFIITLLLLPVAAPIFFDLNSARFIISDTFIPEESLVPIPIGMLTFGIAMCINYFSASLGGGFSRVLRPEGMIKLFVFLIVPFSLHALFMAGLSLPRLMQLLLPVLALSVITIPNNWPEQRRMVIAYLLGGAVFFWVHLLSLHANYEDLWNLSHIDFSFINGVLIYQALVSYPGVLSIFFFFSIAIIASQNFSFPRKLLAIFAASAVVMLMLIASRRVSLIEICGGLIIFVASFLLGAFAKGKTSAKKITTIFGIPIALSLFYLLVKDAPIFVRAEDSASLGTFDSGRIDIYMRAMSYFSESPIGLFFGAGGSGAVGFHNFFLDTIYRVGLLGLLFLFAMLVYVVKNIKNLRAEDFVQKEARYGTLACLFFLLIVQTFVNASISQPYYAINILVPIIFVWAFVFRRRDWK